MKKKQPIRKSALRKKAHSRPQLNMEVNPRVIELITVLKKNTNLKLAMKGRISNPKLVWYGLSLLARQYKIKVVKKQLDLF